MVLNAVSAEKLMNVHDEAGSHRPRRRESSESRSGLTFDVARTLNEAEQAWELVYRSYLRAGLIAPNAQHLHLLPQAVRPSAAVMIGRINGLTVSTMSVYLDAEGPLPLDLGYAPQLNAMRRDGRRLMEAGLFADRREHIARSLAALMELMRHTFFYAVYQGAHDIVIGVHPHHAGFYEKCLGFEQFGEESGCPHTNNAPLVPLRLDIHRKFNQERLPRGLAFFKSEPLQASAFDGRIQLGPDAVSRSRTEVFLAGRGKHADAA